MATSKTSTFEISDCEMIALNQCDLASMAASGPSLQMSPVDSDHGPTPSTTDTTIITLTVDRSRRPNPGEPQKWSAHLGEELIVKRKVDPEHAACRVLLSKGITGRVTFVHADNGMAGLTMDIETGAKFSTVEDDAGLRTIPYVPFPLHGLHKEPGQQAAEYDPTGEEFDDAVDST
jgi:hypothetical protein